MSFLPIARLSPFCSPVVAIATMACALATAATAQTGRTMSLPIPPVAGQDAVFQMNHPSSAAGRFNFFWLSTHTAAVAAVPIPGFASSGLVRIDPLGVLLNQVTLLDVSGSTSWTLAIPNVPNAVGFTFDVQTADLDFATSQLAWADNDIEAVVTAPLPRLVINEIDYDQVLSDTASYIEIYNAGPGVASLAGVEMRLVNGVTSLQYDSFALSNAAATLAPGGYLIIGNSSVTSVMPPTVATLTVVGDFLQNGAPDGVALVDTGSGQVLDRLSYEGSILAASLTGFVSPVSLVEGTAFAGADSNTVTRSLVRLPSGGDTDNAIVDWALTASPTPGAANL